MNNKEIETIMKIEDVLKESGLEYEILRLPPDEENLNWSLWIHMFPIVK